MLKCQDFDIYVTSLWTSFLNITKWAVAWDFQQFDILTSVDSDQPVQPSFKHRTSKKCSVSSFTPIEYSSDEQRLWSDCAYTQSDLSLCSSHKPHCWKSHALAQILVIHVLSILIHDVITTTDTTSYEKKILSNKTMSNSLELDLAQRLPGLRWVQIVCRGY